MSPTPPREDTVERSDGSGSACLDRMGAGPAAGALRALRGALANPLGRRVIAWIVLWSCVLALILAVAQLSAVHRREVNELESRLDALGHASVTGLGFAVWNLDQSQMDAQLAGMRALPDLSYAAVYDQKGHVLAEYGARPRAGIARRFPIRTEQPNAGNPRSERVTLGELEVVANLDGVYASVRDEAFAVLTSEIATTLCGTLVMLLIFRRLVSRPLSALAHAAEKAGVDNLGLPIALARSRHAPDDFDTLVDAMNRMRASLKREVDALQSTRDDLSASEIRYRRLVESTNVVAWELEAATGRITFVAPQIEQLLGFDAPTWSARGFCAASVDADDLEALDAALAGDADQLSIECRFISAAGQMRWLAVVAERNAALPASRFWHGHLIDIDDRKRTEIALAHSRSELETRVAERTAELRDKVAEVERRREEQAQLFRDLEAARNHAMQSDKLASIGQLAAGVAHEINNPIGFVLSNFTSLERYVADLMKVLAAYEKLEPLVPPTAGALLQVASARADADMDYLKGDLGQLLSESRDGLDRVRRIVQDLKDFAREGDAHWQPADLVRGLESTLNVVRNEIKYKAEIVKNYASLPEVDCVPSQLNQVFMNLLVNAAQAISQNGTITLSCGTQDDQVWIAIADTGCGMTQDVLNRVFDPFFTTKPVGSGTGLGLSVSYSIVKRHGGRMEVTSALGEGSTFRIWLPIHHAETLVPSVA